MRFPLPISWHIQDWSDNRIGAYVRTVLPAFQQAAFPFWIKGIDPPIDRPDWAVPGVNVLGRIYEDDNATWADMANGTDGAWAFFDRFKARWLERPWVTMWTMGNEPHPPGDRDFLVMLNGFLMELADLMHGAGLKCAGPNLSVGWPDIGDAPLLGPAIQKLDRLCLHEYSAPAMWNQESWLVGRVFRTITELTTAGYTDIPPVLIGETGIDGGVIGNPRTGWRSYATVDEYVQQLAWQARLYLDHLGLVESAFIFTVAPPGWGWDDFLPTDELFEKVTQAVLAGYEVDEEPVPVPPPRFEIKYVVGSLPHHPTKEYDRREIGAIEGVVIHHAGYTYPADATENQVRDHLDVIANYHINHNDWPGIAYHFVVDGTGRIWQTNSAMAISYHAGTRNLDTIGVCMLGAFHLTDDPTPAQLRSVNCLFQWLEDILDKTLVIMPHKAIVATACPGKYERWWTDITEPCGTCFEEPDDGEGEMDPIIIDRNGLSVGLSWADAQAQYGLSLVRATPPEGSRAWRVKRIIMDTTAETNMRLYARDATGAPLAGIVPLFGILPPSGMTLPADAAPRINADYWEQPAGKPNQALLHADNSLNFTSVDGYVQHSLGSGSNYIPPGPGSHWSWVMPGNDEDFTDVLLGLGMWENHQMFWPEFWLEEGDGPDEPEEPEEGAAYVVHVPEITITVTVPAFTMSVLPVQR